MFAALIAAASLTAGTSAALPAPPAPSEAAAPVAVVNTVEFTQIVPARTPIRLMVVKEVNSRTARQGDRFKLRVDEPVFINGSAAIPVGTAGWGEVVSLERNGAVGKGGRLATRLLYLDTPAGRLPLRGDATNQGSGNGAGVVLAVVGFGIFGLLTGGDSARLKAGELITAYAEQIR